MSDYKPVCRERVRVRESFELLALLKQELEKSLREEDSPRAFVSEAHRQYELDTSSVEIKARCELRALKGLIAQNSHYAAMALGSVLALSKAFLNSWQDDTAEIKRLSGEEGLKRYHLCMGRLTKVADYDFKELYSTRAGCASFAKELDDIIAAIVEISKMSTGLGKRLTENSRHKYIDMPSAQQTRYNDAVSKAGVVSIILEESGATRQIWWLASSRFPGYNVRKMIFRLLYKLA